MSRIISRRGAPEGRRIVANQHLIVAILMLCANAGCHGLIRTHSICQPAHAYHAGEEQALSGKAIDYTVGAACSGDSRETFVINLDTGYQAGRQRYCSPESVYVAAMTHGKSGLLPGFRPEAYDICDNVSALQVAYSSGHAAGVEQFCAPGPAEQAGAADGSQGRPAQFSEAHYRMCSKDSLERLIAAYRQGYERGLARFCAPEPWEAAGREHGIKGNPAADVRQSVLACRPEQQERVALHYRQGYERGLAQFCAPERWETWAHAHGLQGSAAVDIRGLVMNCSSLERESIRLHYQRGHRNGLSAYCSTQRITDAGRAAAQQRQPPHYPTIYALCFDVFPHLTTVFHHAYQTELAWLKEQSVPVMSADVFQTLLTQVKSTGVHANRLDLIREAVRHYYLTVAQVIDLMRACDYEHAKIEVAIALYPAVADRANWFQVYGALDTISSQDMVREGIRDIP